MADTVVKRIVLTKGIKYIMECTEVVYKTKNKTEGIQTKEGLRWYFWVHFIDNANVKYRCEYKSSSPDQTIFKPGELSCFRVIWNGDFEDVVEPDYPDDSTLGSGLDNNATNSNSGNVPRETYNLPNVSRPKDCAYRLEAMQMAVQLTVAGVNSGKIAWEPVKFLPETYWMAANIEAYLCNPDN